MLKKHPQFTGFSNIGTPVANSIYNGFQLRVEKRLSKGLQFLVTYVDSKDIDDSSAVSGNTVYLGGTTSLQDPNDRRLERGLSEYDIAQVLQVSYVYQLPFGRGMKFGSGVHPIVNALLGGWQTNGIWRFDTGMPIRLTLSGGRSLPTYGDAAAKPAGAVDKEPRRLDRPVFCKSPGCCFASTVRTGHRSKDLAASGSRDEPGFPFVIQIVQPERAP